MEKIDSFLSKKRVVTYSYADACIYFLLYSKGLLGERWVGDWTELQHIDPPPTLLAITAFLSRSPGLLNRGPRGPSLCCDTVLISASSLQLIWTLYHTGLYNNLTPTYLWASHLHSIQQSRLSPISSTGCTCYLHRCISYLTAQLDQRSICYRVSWVLNITTGISSLNIQRYSAIQI